MRPANDDRRRAASTSAVSGLRYSDLSMFQKIGVASYGCIRMHNEDITDLFGRVEVGTHVVAMR